MTYISCDHCGIKRESQTMKSIGASNFCFNMPACRSAYYQERFRMNLIDSLNELNISIKDLNNSIQTINVKVKEV